MQEDMFDDDLAALRAEYVNLDDQVQSTGPQTETIATTPMIVRPMRKKPKNSAPVMHPERKKAKKARIQTIDEGNLLMSNVIFRINFLFADFSLAAQLSDNMITNTLEQLKSGEFVPTEAQCGKIDQFILKLRAAIF